MTNKDRLTRALGINPKRIKLLKIPPNTNWWADTRKSSIGKIFISTPIYFYGKIHTVYQAYIGKRPFFLSFEDPYKAEEEGLIEIL